LSARGEDNIWQGFSGTAVAAVVLMSAAIYEWEFGWRRVAADAVVVEGSYVAPRSGQMFAEVTFRVGDDSVRATLRTFFHAVHVGDRVPILYLPSDPHNVTADLYWQRYFGSTLAFATAAILLVSDCLKYRFLLRKRSSILLGDDPVEELVLPGLAPRP
jgi:hypothetical protein